MTLYELTDEYRQLLDMAEDAELDPQVFQDTLEALGGEIELKAENYAIVMKELEGSLTKLSAEIQRLTERKRVIENNITRMKQSLQNAMYATGKTKFKTDKFSFNIQKNPASVFIPDDSQVPEQFLISQPPKVDKAAVKDFLKGLDDNDICNWATLTQGESLRIK